MGRMNQTINFVPQNEDNGSENVSWSIIDQGKEIGKICIQLNPSENIEPPYLMCNLQSNLPDTVLVESVKHAMKYAYCNIASEALHAVYSVTDTRAANTYKLLGFEKDDEPYEDADGQQCQNVKIVL